MKLKEDNIDIYNNSAIILNSKTPSFIKLWIIILFILSLVFTSILFIPFNIYSTYYGYVVIDNEDSYINLSLNKSDFPVNKNNKLYIGKDEYQYKIINITDNNVLLDIKLKNSIKINNNILAINVLKNRTTIFNIIKNKIKKGFDL